MIPESVERAIAAKGDRKTDFERVKATISHQEPDYVPIFEMGIEPEIKQQFMGRPLEGHVDEIQFYRTAGYDAYPVSLSVLNYQAVDDTPSDSDKVTGLEITTKAMTKTKATKATLEAYTERHWAEMHKGIISTREEFDAYPWPDPDDLNFSVLDEVGALLPDDMKIAVVIGKIFTGVWFMLGMETFMLAYIDDPEFIEMMYGKIVPLQQRAMQVAMDHPSVGMSFHADDLSGKGGPLVHPDHYRKYAFPCYRTMCDMARAADKPFIYHTDGDISMVIEDLIDVGIHGWHPVEKQAHDINEIKAEYGDRIAILGNIDLQYTLTKGTPEEVDDEVRTRIRDLAPGGGYCVSSGNSVPEYVPIDNYAAMLEATFRYGKYPISVQ